VEMLELAAVADDVTLVVSSCVRSITLSFVVYTCSFSGHWCVPCM
jgi:hypothetical protein